MTPSFMMTGKFRAGIRNKLDVFQRIAVDKKQVRKRTLFYNAELAGIGIALARQRQ